VCFVTVSEEGRGLQELGEPVKFPFARHACPHQFSPELVELRQRGPVLPAELPDGRRAWLVTGLEEARTVFADLRFSRAVAAQSSQAKHGVEMIVTESILSMDPPEHTRLRKLIAGTFTMRRAEGLRTRVAGIIDELIAEMKAGQRPADLVRAFSLPLPVRVVCELLGVPVEDRERFCGWSDRLFGDWHYDRERMEAALDALVDYIHGLVAIKRENPGEDLISSLIAARDDGDRLSEHELVMLCAALLVAGHETTANHISMSVVTLMTNPAELSRLRANPDLIPVAIEELLRFVQLAPGVPLIRIATEDMTLGGVSIKAGDITLPLVHAADRDQRVFPGPDLLDISRNPVHLAFGAGVHKCVGAHIARVELDEAFRGLLLHLPGLRLAVPVEELRYKPNMIVNNLYELPVTWDEE
jgi:cytochrome P450